jgi:hypothetical protein
MSLSCIEPRQCQRKVKQGAGLALKGQTEIKPPIAVAPAIRPRMTVSTDTSAKSWLNMARSTLWTNPDGPPRLTLADQNKFVSIATPAGDIRMLNQVLTYGRAYRSSRIISDAPIERHSLQALAVDCLISRRSSTMRFWKSRRNKRSSAQLWSIDGSEMNTSIVLRTASRTVAIVCRKKGNSLGIRSDNGDLLCCISACTD